jgi:hypothetical protein
LNPAKTNISNQSDMPGVQIGGAPVTAATAKIP